MARVRRCASNLLTPERPFRAFELTTFLPSRPTNRDGGETIGRRTGPCDGETLFAMRDVGPLRHGQFADSEQTRVKTLRRWAQVFQKPKTTLIFYCALFKRGASTEATPV